METPDLRAGVPAPKPKRTVGAAGICQGFMESGGWLSLFEIAGGRPYKMLVYSKLTGRPREVLVTPDADQRLQAIKLITSYAYGRPAELARSDDSGRTVTDLLLAALRPNRDNEAGPR